MRSEAERRMASARAPEGQIVTVRSRQRMNARLYRQNAVEAQPRRTAPHHHIAMLQQHALHGVAALEAAELKYRRQTERNGNDRLAQIFLIFILMQRQLRARLIAIDQTGVGLKVLKARLLRRRQRRARNASGIGGQRRPVRLSSPLY